MTIPNDDLLRPTLSQGATIDAPYSVQTTFFTAFFGGPFASVLITALNSYRLRRAGRDLPGVLAMLAAVLISGYLLYRTSTGFVVRDWLQANIGSSGAQILQRLIALLLIGAGYLLHRREQRNSDLMGLTRPNGWIAGIACGVAGYGLALLFTHWLLQEQ